MRTTGAKGRGALVAASLAVAAVACSGFDSATDGTPPAGPGGDASVAPEGGAEGAAPATLLESGAPTKIVQVVAGTSLCPYDASLALCAGAADSHTCALRNDRSVYCWGSDRWGRLGFVPADDGLDRKGQPVDVPRRVAALDGKGARALAAGADHTCAVLDDGDVWCWGYNWNGQLGVTAGSESDAEAGKGQPPGRANILVAGRPFGANEIAAGQGVTCARDRAGAVACVGKANDNETRVFSTHPFAQIAIGWKTACGRTATGALWCSGDNAAGQVIAGGATFVDQTMLAASGVLDVRVGYAHICAQFAAGAFCWGSGAAFGTTGNVSVASRVEVKAVAAGGAVASLVEAGGGHTCWVQNGAVHCAGANGDGQASTSVVRAEGGSLQNVRDLAASTTHTCALTVDGELFCWGSNAYGQLGQPTASVLGSPLAMRVTLPP